MTLFPDVPAASPGWHRYSAAHPAAPGQATVAVYGADLPSEDELRLLGDLEGSRVLDLGCGGGHNAVVFAKQGAKVIAVDPSAERLAAARQRAEDAGVRIEWHEGDLAELPFLRSDSVDAVVSAMALTEVDDLARVFRQVHRVLKPESAFVFTLPHPAFGMLDPTGAEPLRVQRAYDDDTPVTWDLGRDQVTDHPRTISAVFTTLHRANFRVDQLLEPLASRAGSRSPWFTEAMQFVPATVLFRARKQGN
ncbi:MAG: Methyltransferase domain [Acidimicrobiales bacterium]|nr:Methyltransferase domain [Acidimicrobiales bacterium]